MSRWNAKHFVGMNGVGDLSRYIVGETTKRASLCSRTVENELLARDAVSTYICIMQIEFLAWILLLLLTTKPFITLHAFSNNFYSGIAKFLTESILVIDYIYTYVLIFGMNEWMLNTESFNFSVLWWPEPISQPDAGKKHVSDWSIPVQIQSNLISRSNNWIYIATYKKYSFHI